MGDAFSHHASPRRPIHWPFLRIFPAKQFPIRAKSRNAALLLLVLPASIIGCWLLIAFVLGEGAHLHVWPHIAHAFCWLKSGKRPLTHLRRDRAIVLMFWFVSGCFGIRFLAPHHHAGRRGLVLVWLSWHCAHLCVGEFASDRSVVSQWGAQPECALAFVMVASVFR